MISRAQAFQLDMLIVKQVNRLLRDEPMVIALGTSRGELTHEIDQQLACFGRRHAAPRFVNRLTCVERGPTSIGSLDATSH